ncbi:MAG: nicotinate-nucleotide--dimethylbenzimidazole phosphoribosyltransferase [Alphaproteobacteria bacterium]
MSDRNINSESHWWEKLASSLDALPGPDEQAREAARARQDTLTKPQGALGKLEDLACWLAAWQGREMPRLSGVETLIFAGNHGVTAQGVSPYPSSVTAQMVENFKSGGAAICQLCETYGAELRVIALDLDTPTCDMTLEPAMNTKQCEDAIARGAAAVPDGADLLLLGEMGIGNTTAAAALCCTLLGGSPAFWTGPGTGLDAHGVARKADVVSRALALHVKHCPHPFETLRRLGGRELAAIAGAILETRKRRIPVLLDGYVCCAAALVLEKAKAGALDHCLAGHLSAEPAHPRLLENLGKEPIVDLGMRLGEGTGAAVALGILRGAVAAHNGMATFAEAHVDGRE